MIGDSLNTQMHYIYSWARDGELIVKHFYGPSLVDCDKQFKELMGFDPSKMIPAVNVQRITNE